MSMPKVGAPAPGFSLPDQTGQEVSLATLAGRYVVLYFYPKDDTPGCTVQACGFRDDHSALEAAGAVVVGVSPDATRSHQRFADKYNLPFPLLADTEHRVAEAYGVWALKRNYGREYMGILRTTFLIGPDGTVLRVWEKVKVKEHAAEVLESLRAAAGGALPVSPAAPPKPSAKATSGKVAAKSTSAKPAPAKVAAKSASAKSASAKSPAPAAKSASAKPASAKSAAGKAAARSAAATSAPARSSAKPPPAKPASTKKAAAKSASPKSPATSASATSAPAKSSAKSASAPRAATSVKAAGRQAAGGAGPAPVANSKRPARSAGAGKAARVAGASASTEAAPKTPAVKAPGPSAKRAPQKIAATV